MKVTHCISRLGPDWGGPSRSVPCLAEAEARQGVDVELLHVADDSVSEAEPVPGFARGFGGSFPAGMAASREMKTHLQDRAGGDVFHGHGIWELPVHYMARAARRLDRPYLIAPRGMLEPWALRSSPRKKALAGLLFQKRDLRRADCLHALTANEAASFRSYGLNNPVAVVPNGVDIAAIDGLDGAAARLGQLVPQAAGRRVALFLSRIHPKKGLPVLLQAWQGVHSRFPDWLLVVAGPDRMGHRAQVERRAADLGLRDAVAFAGALYGADKTGALAGADLFVLPSFSEGFSMAVLEAMAAGLPVLITPGCSFPEAEREGAALVVEPQARSVAAGLEELMSVGEPARRQMGGRGRRLVEAEYTWPTVAERMVEVYDWLLGRRPMPSCVRTD